MRSFVALLALCALATAWRNPAELAPRFTSGHEYVYTVDQQLATTLMGEQQHGLQRIRSVLRVVFPSEKKAVCKITGWEMARINDQINADEEQLVAFERLQRVDIDGEHQKLLELPFELRYEQGRISEIIFSQEDKTFTENMKRAIINSLQFRMDQEEPLSHYRVNETTIDGQCENIYTIEPEAECRNNRNQKSCVRLVKSVNFEQCTRTPELRYNFYRAEMPAEHQPQQAIQRLTSVEVELKRDHEDKHIPVYTRTRSQYSMQVSLSREQYLHGVAVTELRLKDAKQAGSFLEVETKKTAQTLEYSSEFDLKRERFYESGQEDYLNAQQYIQKSSIVDVVNHLMKALSQTFVADNQKHWELDSEAAHIFLSIVKSLRHATVADLERIDNNIVNRQKFAQNLLTDAMAAAGTQPTIKFLLAKIENNGVTEQRAISLLQKLAANAQFVGEETSKSVWKLCQQKQDQKNLYQSCILSWSRLVRTVCSEKFGVGDVWAMNVYGASKSCDTEFRMYLVNNLKALLEKSSNTDDRVLALKAIGNIGLDLMITHVEQIVRDRSLDQIQRQVAIEAFRFMDHRTSRKIAHVLMPVFTDRREFPEIRMEAFRQLMNRRIDHGLLDQVVVEIIREPNMNVRAFVATYLMNHAETVQQIDAQLAKKMINCVRMIKSGSVEQQRRMERASSRFNSFNLNNNMLTFARIFSNDSRVFKDLDLQWNAMINQHFLPIFQQLNLKQQNIEKVVKDLLNKFDDKPIDQILVRGRRSTLEKMSTPIQTLKSIYDQLKIIGRSAQGKPQFLLAHREQGMDIAYGYFDEQNIPEFIRTIYTDGQIDLSALESTDSEINYSFGRLALEQTVKIPTTFGVPMVYTVHAPVVAGIYGKYTVKIDGEKHLIKKANIALNLLPKYASQLVQKLEAVSPLFTVGVQTQHNIAAQFPLKINGLYNEQKGLKVELELPHDQQHTYKLLQVSSHPSTLVRTWPKESRVYVESEDRTLYVQKYNQLYKELDREFNCPLTGLRYEVRGHFQQCRNVECWLVGENALQIHLHPTETSAKKMIATLKFHTEQPTSVSMNKLSNLFDEKNAAEEMFKNVKQSEQEMLKEFIRNFSSDRNTKVVTKFLLEGISRSDKHISSYEKNVEVICDNKFITCSVEAHSSFKQNQINLWKAHISGQFARPQLTGVYGGMKSRHVLLNLAARIGGQEKNSGSLRFYGRPSAQSIRQWNLEASNQSNRDDQMMSQEEHDQFMLTHLPSSLPANMYNVVFENRLTQWTSETIRPLLSAVQLYMNPIDMLLNNMWNDEKAMPKHNFIATQFIYQNGQLIWNTGDASIRTRLPALSSFDDNQESARTIYDSEFDWEEKQQERRLTHGQRRPLAELSGNTMARCTMNNKYTINSFDGKTYRIPLTNCYTVLSKDCSGESKYSVLAKKLEDNRYKIKLVTPRGEYTMQPEEDRVIIKVDGELIKEREFPRYGITQQKTGQKTIYIFHCERTGTELRFDGQNLAVFLTEEYINRQCGVCGHYSNDETQTFRMANNQRASSMKNFHSSYLYRDNECKSEDYETVENRKESDYNMDFDDDEEDRENRQESEERKQKKQNQNDVDFDDEEQIPSVSPVKSNRIQEYRELICFSLQQYTSCPEGSIEKNSKKEEVKFACYDRQDSQVRQLRRQAQRNQKLDLDEEADEKLISINIPKRCLRVESNDDFDF